MCPSSSICFNLEEKKGRLFVINSTRLLTFFFPLPLSPLTALARNVATQLVINKYSGGNVLLHHYVVEALIHTSNEL